MKICHPAMLLALALLAPSSAAQLPRTTEPGEALVLATRDDPNLESLRAGWTRSPTPLAAMDRAALREAESRSADLLEMRAGEMTDHDWTLVAVGLLIVVLIILI